MIETTKPSNRNQDPQQKIADRRVRDADFVILYFYGKKIHAADTMLPPEDIDNILDEISAR